MLVVLRDFSVEMYSDEMLTGVGWATAMGTGVGGGAACADASFLLQPAVSASIAMLPIVARPLYRSPEELISNHHTTEPSTGGRTLMTSATGHQDLDG